MLGRPKDVAGQKAFIHHSIDLGYDDLPTVEVDGKRRYQVRLSSSSGATVAYPSITTVLGFDKQDALNDWRERVGPTESERVTRVACARGTSLHSLVERYIGNQSPVITPNEMPGTVSMFRALLPVLNTRIGKVYLQERPLYSTHLRVAGRTDLIAQFDGRLAVIDVKSSGRVKTRGMIKSYFMQEAAYAIMFEERTGIPIDRLVTLMAVAGSKEPLIFIEKRDDWVPDLLESIRNYERANGSPVTEYPGS